MNGYDGDFFICGIEDALKKNGIETASYNFKLFMYYLYADMKVKAGSGKKQLKRKSWFDGDCLRAKKKDVRRALRKFRRSVEEREIINYKNKKKQFWNLCKTKRKRVFWNKVRELRGERSEKTRVITSERWVFSLSQGSLILGNYLQVMEECDELLQELASKS